MAATQVFTGSFAINTTTGNQTVTVTGLRKGKYAKFVASGRTTDEVGGTDGRYGFLGIAVSSSKQAATSYADDACRHTNDKCILLVNGAATVVYEAAFVSFADDQFTIDVTTAPATALIVLYEIVAGDGAEADLLQSTSPTSTGTQDLTGHGFHASGVELLSIGYATAPNATDSGDGRLGYGVGSSPSNRATIALFSNNNNQNHRSKQLTDRVLHVLGSINSVLLEADLNAIGHDLVQLQWNTVNGTGRYFWALAVKGPRLHAVAFNQATTTGQASVTGVPFKPVLADFFGFALAASTAIQTDARMTYGAATSSSSRWCKVIGHSNQDTAILDRTKCIVHATGTSSPHTVSASADFVSFNGDGCTIDWTVADATARQVIGWFMGPVSSPVFPGFAPRHHHQRIYR